MDDPRAWQKRKRALPASGPVSGKRFREFLAALEAEELESEQVKTTAADVRGYVKDPLADNAIVLQYKYQDIYFNVFRYRGYLGDDSIPLNQIDLGSTAQTRVGRRIVMKGYEYRLRLRNFQFPEQTLAPAIVGSTRTIPPVQILSGQFQSTIRDNAGNRPILSNLATAGPPPVPNLYAGNGNAGIPVLNVLGPAGNMGNSYFQLDVIEGPTNDIELQPQQTNVVDQPATAEFTLAQQNPEDGSLCSTRMLFFIDNEGQSFYTLGGAYPTGIDVLATPAQLGAIPGGCALYNMNTITRFGIVEDTTWSTQSKQSTMMAVKPAKQLDYPVIFNNSIVSYDMQETGGLFFYCASDDNELVGDSKPYQLDGMIRVFWYDD